LSNTSTLDIDEMASRLVLDLLTLFFISQCT